MTTRNETSRDEIKFPTCLLHTLMRQYPEDILEARGQEKSKGYLFAASVNGCQNRD